MSCNSSLIVLLAPAAALATPLFLSYNSPTLCYSRIEDPSPQCVRIHFHVLFKPSSSIRSTLSRIELFVSAAELFLADRIRGSSSVREVRDMVVFSQTAQSSLKRPGPNIWCVCAVCSWSAGGSADSHFIIWWPRVLTVSCLYPSRQN